MKNVPIDAGWRFWNWRRRFTGLIGEDQTGKILLLEYFVKKYSYLNTIVHFSSVGISPTMEEEKNDIRQNDKSGN